MGLASLDGKLAFVTGGASGIGLGIVRALVKRGCRVIIADLRQDHIDTAMASLGQTNLASAITLDVADREAYAAAAARIEAEFGGIDVLVNNAGVGSEGPIRQAAFVDWDFGLGVNLGGVVNGITCFLPQMLAHGRGGQIVTTSSLAACVRMPSNFAIYAAAKAAVLNLSENLRADLAQDNIGVSVLLPGFVRSNIHEAAMNRPAHLRAGSGFSASEASLLERPPGEDWMDPDHVGEMVAEGILADAPYIVTHGVFANQMRARFDALMAAVPPSDFQF